MGNHEYCEDCGESDFHHHRPCDPVKLAKKKQEKENQLIEKEIRIERMKVKLNSLGLKYQLTTNGASLSYWDF